MSDNGRVKMTTGQRQIAVVLVERQRELDATFRQEMSKVNAALTALAETVWQTQNAGEIPDGMRPRFEQVGRDVYVVLAPIAPVSRPGMPVQGPAMEPLDFEEE